LRCEDDFVYLCDAAEEVGDAELLRPTPPMGESVPWRTLVAPV